MYEIIVYNDQGASEVYKCDTKLGIRNWLRNAWNDPRDLSAMIFDTEHDVEVGSKPRGRKRIKWNKTVSVIERKMAVLRALGYDWTLERDGRFMVLSREYHGNLWIDVAEMDMPRFLHYLADYEKRIGQTENV